jgi:hypothetical protein
LKAATAVADSVEKQQLFHTARKEWAEDLLAPLQGAYTEANDAFNAVSGMVDIAVDELAAAK